MIAQALTALLLAGTFATQTSTPDLFTTKVAVPGQQLPLGLTSVNVTSAADLNALENAVLDLRTEARQTIHVRHYGAVGDNSNDDSEEIQAAITAAGSGGTIVLEKGKTYYVPSGLTSSVPVNIEGNGATLRSATHIYSVTGSRATYSGFTPVSVVASQQTFTLPAATTLSAGEIVFLKSTDIRVDISGTNDYFHGIVATVLAVSGGVARLSVPFYDAFNVTSFTAYTSRPGLTIRNTNFDLTGVGSTALSYGISAVNAVGDDILIEGCRFTGSEYAGYGVDLKGSNIIVRGNYFRGFLNKQGLNPGGRVGYGAQPFGNNLLIEQNVFEDCKHGVATGGREYVSRNYRIIGNMFINDPARATETTTLYDTTTEALFSTPIDSHAGLLGPMIVEGNRVESPALGGHITVRNGEAYIVGNTFIQHTTTTAGLINIGEKNPTNIVVERNTFQMASPTSRVFNLPSSLTAASGLRVLNNQVTDGVLLYSSQNLTLSDITVSGNVVSGVLVSLAGTGALSNLVVDANRATLLSTASDSALIQINTKTATGVVISNNELDASAYAGNVNPPINIAPGTNDAASALSDVRITGNKTKQHSGNWRGLSIARYATVARLLVSGNTIEGCPFFGASSSAYDNTFSDVLITGNTITGTAASTTGFLLSKGSTNAAILDRVSFIGNVFNYGVGGSGNGLLFDNPTFTNPVLVQGNRFRAVAGTNAAVGINASAVTPIVTLVGNIADKVLLSDSTSAYAGTPVGNVLSSGSAATWRGGTTYGPDGRLFRSAAPVAGTWAVTNTVWNDAPAGAGVPGWVCTAAGTPGTWKAMAALAP